MADTIEERQRRVESTQAEMAETQKAMAKVLENHVAEFASQMKKDAAENERREAEFHSRRREDIERQAQQIRAQRRTGIASGVLGGLIAAGYMHPGSPAGINFAAEAVKHADALLAELAKETSK